MPVILEKYEMIAPFDTISFFVTITARDTGCGQTIADGRIEKELHRIQ